MGAGDVVQWIQEKSPDARAASAAVVAARARGAEVGRYANPQVAWERESLAGTGDESLTLALPVDLSSRRSTKEYLAARDVARARARVARVHSDLALKALLLLYEGVALRERVVIEQGAVTRLQEATRVVARRREAGRASGYDLTRIELRAAASVGNSDAFSRHFSVLVPLF